MTIESAGPAPAQPVEAAPRRKSFFERLVGVFFSPGETFDDIARKPDWVLPLLVLLLIGIASTIVVVPRLDFDAVVAQQEEMMEKQGRQLSEGDRERMGRITRSFGRVMAYITPLFILAGYVLIALVLWGAFRLMGGEGTFPQALSATLYAHMPRMLLGGIIGIIVLLLRDGLIDPAASATLIKSNPAFLVDMKEQPVLFALLSSFDIFVLWTIALLTVGFAKLSRLSVAKSAAIVVVLWAVTIVVKLGFAALGAMQMKG